MPFILDLQRLIEWIDSPEAAALDRNDVTDTVRLRLVELMQSCIAEPHCSNFSLLPEPVE